MDYTLFTALLLEPGTQQVKVVYGIGTGTASIYQTSPIPKKLLMIYGEGGTAIGPSQRLVLYATVRDKILVNNLTPEYFQTGFANGNVVDHQIERKINFTDKEEIIKISPILTYLIYYSFEGAKETTCYVPLEYQTKRGFS